MPRKMPNRKEYLGDFRLFRRLEDNNRVGYLCSIALGKRKLPFPDESFQRSAISKLKKVLS